MPVRLFYVVYFEDQNLQRTLDALRLICNPYAKGRAHITIRGPYRQHYKLTSVARSMKGSEVTAVGADSFFRKAQNTVFIRCQSEFLRGAWKKRDYDYNPHITLYDGPSREFASSLLKRLTELDLRFSFVANGLETLLSVKNQFTLELRNAFDAQFVSTIVGKPTTLDMVDGMDEASRLWYAECLARPLAGFGCGVFGRGPSLQARDKVNV